MERFGNKQPLKVRKVTGGDVHQVQPGPLALLFNAPELIEHIATTFIVTEFGRPTTTPDYINFGLTCQFLAKILFVAPLKGLIAPVTSSQRALAVLNHPLSSEKLDRWGNVTWRVTFETDLCILVFYRSAIVRDGVQQVALTAARMLEKMGEDEANKFIQGLLVEDRFFGKVSKDLKSGSLIEKLRCGTARIETIMYILQCLGFHLQKTLPQPEMPDTFMDDRRQLRVLPSDKVCTQYLGIMGNGELYIFPDLDPHSSALGRRVKGNNRRSGFGQIQDSQELPFVGGPSGSSRAIFSLAMEAQLQNPEHVRQFLLATIAFLVGGGQHSLDEILFGLPHVRRSLGYQHGSYQGLLPQSLTTTVEWRRIQRKYQDYLENL
jgi:hypothetical protein